MYIFFKTIIFMILGAFATTFPNEMKPSNHTFSPPPPKKQQKDRVFQGQYLPSLYINYLAINKDLAKLLPQLY